MRIKRIVLEHQKFQVNALMLLPESPKPLHALITHGYTSSKSYVLSWAQRLAFEGIPCIVFDQPGHFLGSFHEIESFEDFTSSFFELFELASQKLASEQGQDPNNLILAGHSLGALSVLKAMDQEYFKAKEKLAILVGFGMPENDSPHLFQTKLYEDTLTVRAGLVSKHIPPNKIFPWIKSQKNELSLSQEKIILINGKDDLVVGKKGTEEIKRVLEELNNHLTIKEPKRLPHHEPALAAAHVMSAIKEALPLYFS